MSHGRKLLLTQHRLAVFKSTPLLLLIASLPMPSHSSSTSLRLTPTPSTSPPVTSSSHSITNLSNSMTTSFISSSVSNSTTSSATRSPTHDLTPQLFPGANPPDSNETRNASVFNYYFLFLAVFGVLMAVFLWWLHRRRKRRKEQMRLSGQNALARDLDGWVNTRRWFHGAWRHNQAAALIRREEGLNEHGEAPPPYQPKSDVTVAHTVGASHDPASGLSIPLRSLSREDIEQSQPPEYRETISRGRASIVRPDTATTLISRPDTAVQPDSSTVDLVRNATTQ